MRYVLSCLIKPAPIFCFWYRSFLSNLDAEFFIVIICFQETLPAELPLIGRFTLTEESFQSGADDVQVDDFGGTVSVYSATVSEAHQPSCSEASQSQVCHYFQHLVLSKEKRKVTPLPVKLRKS